MRFLVIVAAAAGLVGCSVEEAPPAKTIKSADPTITDVELGMGPNINVRLSVPAEPLSLRPGVVGGAVRQIARALQSGAPGRAADTKWLQVQVDVRGSDGRTDDFGNLRFPVDQLLAVDFKQVSAEQALNLADTVTAGTGRAFEGAVAYCAEEAFRAVSPRYCSLVDAEGWGTPGT